MKKKFCIILFENIYVILPSKRLFIAKHIVHSYIGRLSCPGCENLASGPERELGQGLTAPGSDEMEPQEH